MYQIEVYVTVDGKEPFNEWLLSLRDKAARDKLTARVDRAAHGNFGDWKPLTGMKGLFELREHHGPGHRVYFAMVGQTVLLLLAGSTKKDQRRVIRKAAEYLADYHRRIR